MSDTPHRRAQPVSTLLRELRLAARALRRSPGFTLAAVVTLGLGIGATTSIYTLIDAVVLRPLPYAEADRLVNLGSAVPGMGEDQRWGLSVAGYFHFREHARTLESIGVAGAGETTVTGDFEAERVQLGIASASLFDVLRLTPAEGRPFFEEEERPGAAPVALLGWDYWQRRFGGEPVLGRTIEVNGVAREIVGIMRPGAHLPQNRVDLWVPPTIDPAAPPINAHWVNALARMRPDATHAGVDADLARLTGQFTELFPNAYPREFMDTYGFRTDVLPLHRMVIGDAVARTLWILLAAVALVLLIACANVGNLYQVRVETRRRESAVRGALGASRGQLALHFLGESLLLAGSAAVLGVLLAFAGTRALVALAPPNFPRLGDVGLTSGAVLLALAVAFIAALAFVLVPLLQSGVSMDRLREGGKGSTPSRRRRVARAGLVVTQTALAVVLLAAAGLMLQSYRQLQAVDPGIEPAGVLTFQIALPGARYPGQEPVFEFHRRLVQQLEELPGVSAAGVAGFLPPTMGGGCSALWIEDRPVPEGESAPCMPHATASPGVFDALGVRVRGEPPGWLDMENRSAGVVVTRAFAERFWPGEDAIGKGVRGNGSQPPFYRVVGVAEDIRAHGIDQPPAQMVFFPLRSIDGAPLWNPLFFANVYVRTTGGAPLALLPQARAVLAGLDANVPLANARTLGDVVAGSESMARASFLLLLLLIAGTIALVLSIVGIYGVISYVVAQRTGEISIRLALGADGRAVQRMVVRQSLMMVVLGLALGVGGALAGTRVMTALLFEVSPTDTSVLAAVLALLLAVAALASYLPARRAARVEPMTVLRTE